MANRKFRPVFNTSAAAIVLSRSKSSLLMVKSTVGNKGWGFPKGHIEPGENEIDTALRECEEESGLQKGRLTFVQLQAKVKQVICYPKSCEVAHRVTIFYLFLASCDDLGLPSDNFHTQARWFTRKEFEKLKLRYKYVRGLALEAFEYIK